MAKTFSNIKKSLGLLDFIPIGKYKGCRVDSIIDLDDGYLRYAFTEKILVLDKPVMDKLTLKFNADVEEANSEDDNSYYELEDVPF